MSGTMEREPGICRGCIDGNHVWWMSGDCRCSCYCTAKRGDASQGERR